ncbi:MAG: hypothetical protein VB099_11080 [Candidatus Limiplasma sp.]|nr:hypothetical protein [Candidatus Limiplasma sp.]
MDESDFNKIITESMRNENKLTTKIPERNELLLFLHGLMLLTGRVDIMYCNAFLDEAVQLLSNSIFLYEEGLFDCAFYSVRQAGEVVNSMLYLSENDRGTLEKWSAKDRFPTDSKIREQLQCISKGYQEIKLLIPEYFARHEELIKVSHKIIHKQGFDTFYRLRNQTSDKCGFSQVEETRFFTESLKYTIGLVLIILMILDPISLALSDDDITMKLNFNFMTEPVDVNFFKKYLGMDDVIDRIMQSQFYKEFSSNFEEKETMSPAVYTVVREEAWDISALDEIEKQIDLLNAYERFMFYILKSGLQISNFYFYYGASWYLTSIKCNYKRHTFGKSVFEQYLKPDDRFNQPCENIYISVILMYDEPLFLEHNESCTNDEIQILKELEHQGILKKRKFNEIIKSWKV